MKSWFGEMVPADDARSKHDNNHNYHGSSNPKSTSSKKTKNRDLQRYKKEEDSVLFRAMNYSDEERARRATGSWRGRWTICTGRRPRPRPAEVGRGTGGCVR